MLFVYCILYILRFLWAILKKPREYFWVYPQVLLNRGGGCSQSVEAVGGQSAGRESACLPVTLLLLEPYIARHFMAIHSRPGQPDTAATPKLTITSTS